MSSASGERQGLGRFRALQLHSASTQCQHQKKKLRKDGADAMHFGLCKSVHGIAATCGKKSKNELKTWKKLFSFVKTWHWLSRAKKKSFSSQRARAKISLEKLESADDRERKFLSRASFATFCDTTLASSWVILCLFWVSTRNYYHFDPFTGCFLKFTRTAEKLSAICDHL